MRQNELPRAVRGTNQECTLCGEIIAANEIFALYNNKPYCECCVEDYEEEGRPL